MGVFSPKAGCVIPNVDPIPWDEYTFTSCELPALPGSGGSSNAQYAIQNMPIRQSPLFDNPVPPPAEVGQNDNQRGFWAFITGNAVVETNTWDDSMGGEKTRNVRYKYSWTAARLVTGKTPSVSDETYKEWEKRTGAGSTGDNAYCIDELNFDKDAYGSLQIARPLGAAAVETNTLVYMYEMMSHVGGSTVSSESEKEYWFYRPQPLYGKFKSPKELTGGGDTADEEEWDIDDQGDDEGVKFSTYRLYWSGSAGDPVYQFIRDTQYDSNGRLIKVFKEERSVAFNTGDCEE